MNRRLVPGDRMERKSRPTRLPHPGRTRNNRLVVAAVLGVVSLLVAACGSGNDGEGSSSDEPNEVVVVTYDSYVLPEQAAREFEERTGAKITLIEAGDSADMLTGALLSAGSPEGDVIFGIDDTLAPRALSSDLLEVVDPTITEKVPTRYRIDSDHDGRLVAIDHGEVCMNVDSEWFTAHELDEPRTLEDLTDAKYSGLTVVSSPVTSGPGLAFLIGTVAVFGEDGWQDYWQRLERNGLVVRPSWSDAYYTDYTVSGGKRPVVLSYASSPPAEVIFSDGRRTEPASTVMEASCVSQVEYAGILRGTRNTILAEDLIRTMLGSDWQEQLPLANFVYPVTDVDLPEEFIKWAPAVRDPLELPSDVVATNRDQWIEQWRSIME